ncbi:MAG: hypothetical protein K6F74_05320 [Prevotella sp.]|nr:hypothetical protein [Prevotella sp.]
MAKYIPLDVLVAEIEKLKGKVSDNSSYRNGWQHALRMLELSIDTLGVRDVDLEKESLTWEDMLLIHRHIKDAMNCHLYEFQSVDGQQKIYEEVLRRFKAQKGE